MPYKSSDEIRGTILTLRNQIAHLIDGGEVPSSIWPSEAGMKQLEAVLPLVASQEKEIARLRKEVELTTRIAAEYRAVGHQMEEERDEANERAAKWEHAYDFEHEYAEQAERRENGALRLFLTFYRHVMLMRKLTDNENYAIRALLSRARELERNQQPTPSMRRRNEIPQTKAKLVARIKDWEKTVNGLTKDQAAGYHKPGSVKK